MELMRHGFPLGQVIRTLLFNIRLSVGAMCTAEFLHNWILNPNGLDHFVEAGEVVAPARRNQQSVLSGEAFFNFHTPFFWWDDLDDA